MEKPSSSSGGGAAVAVVILLVLVAIPCLIAVAAGGFLLVGVSRTPVIITPPMPGPTAVKTVVPMRTLVLTVDANSNLTLDGVPVELEAIPERMQELRVANSGASLTVTIQADPTVPFSDIGPVMEKLSAAGVPFQAQQLVVDETAADAPLGGKVEEAGTTAAVEEQATEAESENP